MGNSTIIFERLLQQNEADPRFTSGFGTILKTFSYNITYQKCQQSKKIFKIVRNIY